MGLVSGMVMGAIVGIALMAGWSRMMRYRSTKRVAKVCVYFIADLYFSNFFLYGVSPLISDQSKTCSAFISLRTEL